MCLKGMAMVRDNEYVNKDTVSNNREATNLIPSYPIMIAFLLSTSLIWLSEPLLSLVDTAVVGRGASSPSPGSSSPSWLELAALGPATLLLDNTIYLTYFLSMAAMNRLAPALARNDFPRMITITSHALGVAAILGGLIATVFTGCPTAGRAILAWIVRGDNGGSNGGEAAVVVSSALSYVRIRATVAPLEVMSMVAQSLCLTVLDSGTPAKAIAWAAAVNIFGDVMLVKGAGWGVRGAAFSTAVASLVQAFVLLRAMRRKVLLWKVEAQSITAQSTMLSGTNSGEHENEKPDGTTQSQSLALEEDDEKFEVIVPQKQEQQPMEATVTTSPTTLGKSSTSALRINSDDDHTIQSLPPFVSLPSWNGFVDLVLRCGGPMLLMIVGELVVYSSCTLGAANLGIVSLTTHNILLQLFLVCAAFGDAFTQAAQTFLPRVWYCNQKENDGNETKEQEELDVEAGLFRSSLVRALLSRLFVAALATSILFATVARCFVTRRGASFFTDEDRIISLLTSTSVTRPFALSLLLNPLGMLLQGCLMAMGRVRAMGIQDTLATIASLGYLCYLLGVKTGGRKLASVWKSVVFCQLLRIVQFSTLAMRDWQRSGVLVVSPRAIGSTRTRMTKIKARTENAVRQEEKK